MEIYDNVVEAAQKDARVWPVAHDFTAGNRYSNGTGPRDTSSTKMGRLGTRTSARTLTSKPKMSFASYSLDLDPVMGDSAWAIPTGLGEEIPDKADELFGLFHLRAVPAVGYGLKS